MQEKDILNLLKTDDFSANPPSINLNIESKIVWLLEINPTAINFLYKQRPQLEEFFKNEIIACYQPSQDLKDNLIFEATNLHIFIPTLDKDSIRKLVESIHDAPVQAWNKRFDEFTKVPDTIKEDYRKNMFPLNEETFTLIKDTLQSIKPQPTDDNPTESTSPNPTLG